jgi:divalent metal cation (Fe/Co/Zn/Cd) transporter
LDLSISGLFSSPFIKANRGEVMSKISSKRAILTSFLVDLGDIALNVTVMIITGSVVLLAEALEGASDLVASGLLFCGSPINERTRNTPLGLGKLSFRGPCFPRS